MPSAVTVGERILLHLAQFSKYSDNFDAPPEVSQDGIAEALRISRAHAAIELKKLKETEEVAERLSHIRRGPTKRKVYFLTEKGEGRARRLRDYVTREGIELAPLLDMRRCKAADLWRATPDELRPILGAASVFRKPFRRTALPPTSVTLLPEDENGMVDLPKEIKEGLPRLIETASLVHYHSQAADYWLREGDRRERLYHLVRAGRGLEAEMLLAAHGSSFLSEPDRDLFETVMAVPNGSPRYAAKVRQVKGGVARTMSEHDVALTIAEEQISSSDPSERLLGIKLKGGLLYDRKEYGQAYDALDLGRRGLDHADAELECCIADVLIAQGRADEAMRLIRPLMEAARSGNDLQDLERLYYQMGKVCQGHQEPHEAIKYYSKAVGLAKVGDRRRIYEAMSQSYDALGMKDKGTEYAFKAGIRRSDWNEACPGP